MQMRSSSRAVLTFGCYSLTTLTNEVISFTSENVQKFTTPTGEASVRMPLRHTHVQTHRPSLVFHSNKALAYTSDISLLCMYQAAKY